MGDEWGPWIEHDGKGCPVARGTLVQVERRDGEVAVLRALTNGVPELGGDCLFDRWVHLPKPKDIIRYRVRKPRGVSILEGIVANPPPLPVDPEFADAAARGRKAAVAEVARRRAVATLNARKGSRDAQ